MKREIKFRGVRLDNGEWIYGDLNHLLDGSRANYRSERGKPFN